MLRLELVAFATHTPLMPARTPPTLPRHSPLALSVLRRRRFAISRVQRCAELPPTTSTSQL